MPKPRLKSRDFEWAMIHYRPMFCLRQMNSVAFARILGLNSILFCAQTLLYNGNGTNRRQITVNLAHACTVVVDKKKLLPMPCISLKTQKKTLEWRDKPHFAAT